jgi:hypothetical protein
VSARHALLTRGVCASQGPMCVGRTGGSWLGFLSDTRRAGQAYGLLRWQVRRKRAGVGGDAHLVSHADARARAHAACRMQYEAGEAWAGVEESFLVVPKEARRARCMHWPARAAHRR